MAKFIYFLSYNAIFFNESKIAEINNLLNKTLPVYHFSEKYECVIDAA